MLKKIFSTWLNSFSQPFYAGLQRVSKTLRFLPREKNRVFARLINFKAEKLRALSKTLCENPYERPYEYKVLLQKVLEMR